MIYANVFVRRRMPLLLLALFGIVASLVLAACGAASPYPPTLGKPLVTQLVTSGNTTVGQVTLTPAYGAHVVVYMHGKLLPYNDPKTPAQLRVGSCYGKLVVPLSANAPAAGATLAAQPDAKLGVDVAGPVDANWYVVVLKSTAPNAEVGYCGRPLDTKRQYFDLYLPDRVDNGIGYGSALLEGIVITQVHVSLATPTGEHPAQWSIHSGSCQGSTLATGAIAAGATTGVGTAYAPLDAKTWWLAVTLDGANTPTACTQAG